jgi:S1-C subfamily serine protease
MSGRLIGNNTAILSRGVGSDGIDCAVPANVARSVMTQPITDHKVTRS